jgi:hypothetical protein
MRGLFILGLVGELGSPGKQTDGNCYKKPFVSHVLFVKLLGVLPCSNSRKRLPNFFWLFIYLFFFLSFFQICNAAIVASIWRHISTYLATLLWKKKGEIFTEIWN